MTKPRAIGYVRVSTAEQVEGFGLDVQRKAIRDYCRANGLALVGVMADEGESGCNGLDTRSGLAMALAEVESGRATALVVYRLDRLARDLLLQETLIARLRLAGATILSVTEADVDGGGADPTRDMVRQMLGVIAQYERAVIRGRIMAGRAAKQAKGGYAGGRPAYGKRAEGRQLVPDPDTLPVVAMVKQLRGEGRSYREIAQALTEAGHRPRPKRRDDEPPVLWHPETVRRIAERAMARTS